LILYNIMGIKFDVIQLYGRSLMWYNIMGIRFDMIQLYGKRFDIIQLYGRGLMWYNIMGIGLTWYKFTRKGLTVIYGRSLVFWQFGFSHK
jgi:hypothetical protein